MHSIKDFPLSSIGLLRIAVTDCLNHKKKEDFHRSDVQEILSKYKSVDEICHQMAYELDHHCLYLPPVRFKTIVEWGGTEMKVRVTAIEHIWIQFYDYVAVHVLGALTKRLGFYQCGCIKDRDPGKKGKGQIWGVKQIKNFMMKRHDKYFVKSDVYHCYQSIKKWNMMKFLKRYVKNEEFLWLLDQLLSLSPDGGLLIGSRLSITLCQLYMSDLYHKMETEAFKYSKEWGDNKNVKLFDKMLIFMDDIYLCGKNCRDLHKAFYIMKELAGEMGLTLKPTWTTICTEGSTVNAMGFRTGKKVYNKDGRRRTKGFVKMRRRNYVNTKAALRTFKADQTPKNAQKLISHNTDVKWSSSYRFKKKYKWNFYLKKAKEVISNESKIRAESTKGNNDRRWQYYLYPACA